MNLSRLISEDTPPLALKLAAIFAPPRDAPSIGARLLPPADEQPDVSERLSAALGDVSEPQVGPMLIEAMSR